MAQNPAKADNDSMTDAETSESSTAKARTAPAPDDSRKPDSPADVTKPSWKYVAKKTLREFTKDQCPDLAAALTYYSVLSIFPALLALVSLLGIFGQAEKTTGALLEIVQGSRPPTQWTRSANPSSSSAVTPPPDSPWSSVSSPPCGPPPATSGRSAGP